MGAQQAGIEQAHARRATHSCYMPQAYPYKIILSLARRR
jgi:hypothetical protein